MKIEAVGAAYSECTLNGAVRIDNKDVTYTAVFKDNIAEVSDEVGEQLISDFPYFFPEGKVQLPKQEKKVHVFDETKYQQQEDKIIQLQNSLKVRAQRIEEIETEKDHWKQMYEEMHKRFQELSGQVDNVQKNAPINIEQTELESEDDYRRCLEVKNLDELKKIADDLKVPMETVTKKTAKKAWIDAIINKTFKL